MNFKTSEDNKLIKENRKLTLNQEFFNSVKWTIVKILIYAVILFGIYGILQIDSNQEGKIFKENSLTEWLQILFMVFTSIVFYISGKIDKNNLALMKLLIGLLFIAIIRELDEVLDKFVFDGAWQILALVILLVLSFLVYKHRKNLAPSINKFVKLSSFGILQSGFLIVMVFSRLFGQKIFWKSVMGASYIRSVKDVAEESLELLGYGLIFIGSIEFLLFCKKKATQDPS